MPIPTSWFAQLLAPVLRPVARFVAGLIAIPLLRAVRARVYRNPAWDEELEKDLEQWFRSSLLLFLATKNVEQAIAAWITTRELDIDLRHWWIAGGRLLLAISVIETMPDQQLFSLIHPGPPRPRWFSGLGLWGNLRVQAWPMLRGILCLHLSRSSPVFAILAVIFSGWEGWVFFTLAIAQYLIIGLATSRDRALDVLSQFDRQVARQRRELIHEFDIRQPPEPLSEDRDL